MPYKLLQTTQLNLRLFWDCDEELNDLDNSNKVILMWVPGYSGIKGNSRANDLKKLAANTATIALSQSLASVTEQQVHNLESKETLSVMEERGKCKTSQYFH